MNYQTDIETIIENDLRHARSAAKGRHFHSWVLALVASRTVGRRIDGLTRHLADELGLASVDAIEHWAKAWTLYERIRNEAGREWANLFRREFSVSHFYFMSDYQQRYNLAMIDIINYFSTLLRHKQYGDRWSVDALRMLIMADWENKPTSWRWHWERMMGQSAEMLPSFDGELPLIVKRYVLLGLRIRDRLERER